ncbi:MFS transporter [Asticcacaulis machinosus]|uniref:MFS transporter n=1 Tax=Asticcacaulis machinosus TaxID=2984211 RepID=A0ABT5HP45_9CAUL|nr:MFS transporter [Asticcacaulis machinosus]MDC7677813.1 MFS transporter [Asticcacaulis machinosus]
MTQSAERPANIGLITWLTYLMFMMFAMTTDAVGVIIPQIITEFGLTMTEAGAFHYATMAGIALAGLGLGFLADRMGRKWTIILGLAMFALNSFLFAVGNDFLFFTSLLFISGLSIGVFKTGALALIGDISTSTHSHTRVMNTVEGFFGVGAIIGPLIVTQLLLNGASWKWLYVIAGILCSLLILTAFSVRYPVTHEPSKETVNLKASLAMIKDPYAMAFSGLAMLYVGVETAIYVWMPTLLAGYQGPAMWLALYALSIFFVLRAAGRFLGSWMLARLSWTIVMAICSGAIFVCFALALFGGQAVAVYVLPLSGLFMSVIYPTINSKGISGFKKSQHGAVGGIILFFTCVSAVIAPLAMGAISDAFGDAKYGFVLATVLAALLFAALLFNLIRDPSAARLKALDVSEY